MGNDNEGAHWTFYETVKVDRSINHNYFRNVDTEMTEKIDAVLERVKEPERCLSIDQLGLVNRLRYSEKHQKLVVFTNPINLNHKYCCTVTVCLTCNFNQ